MISRCAKLISTKSTFNSLTNIALCNFALLLRCQDLISLCLGNYKVMPASSIGCYTLMGECCGFMEKNNTQHRLRLFKPSPSGVSEKNSKKIKFRELPLPPLR